MVIFLCYNTSAQTTLIPDSNFEQALIDCNIDTNGLNGNILNSDAQGVITLNIFNKNITNLTGIEAFVDLKNLYSYFNNVEILNLDNNLELEILDVENNSIANLNISFNTNLKEIYISNNLLNTLDVSNNLDLEVLSCSLNNLSELNVTNNEMLSVLWCYSNNLNSLVIENNPLLESLFCGDNDLQNLNVSNNTMLASISCGQNDLDNISLDNCIDLTYLDVSGNDLDSLDLDSNLLLKRLLCSNNNIDELDVSLAPEMLLLYTSNNELREMDLSNNPELKYIRLNNNELSTIDLRNNFNSQISDFNATENPNLTCIFVDNIVAVFLENWIIDGTTNFVANEAICDTLSIEDIEAAITFQIYPNPVADYLNIVITEPNAQVSLFNVNGQLVTQQLVSSGLNRIDLTNMSSGIYLIKLTSKNKSIVKKLIIQ